MSAKKKTTSKKSAAKKAPAKKTAAKKSPAKKKAAAKKSVASAGLSAEERYQRVEFEAYLLAEKNGFAGDPHTYWVEAENIVDSHFC